MLWFSIGGSHNNIRNVNTYLKVTAGPLSGCLASPLLTTLTCTCF